jgi:hypothetical protein
MARKVIYESGYTFTPSTKTITIPKLIPRERLVLITNVTTNQVIYNFSDPSLKATSYTLATTDINNPRTTIVLNYNTASMSSSHKLSIIFDEFEERFIPGETYTDPVNKFRVSQPQALIDTDFEYSVQNTKWENLTQINYRPFVYPTITPISNINYISYGTGSKTVFVGLTTSTGCPGVGTAISVQDTFLTPANGNFLVQQVFGIPGASGPGTFFTYSATATNSTAITQIFDSNKTGIFTGSLFTSARIGGTPLITTSTSGVVTVTTSVPHGLSVGNEVAIRGMGGTNPCNGSFSIVGIPSSRAFIIGVSSVPLLTGANNGANPGIATGAEIYVRPPGQVLHRPFDGGVIFSSNANGNYERQIRQTRRYFRYQSGKGIQVSSGTIIKPAFQVDSITSVGTAVTVITKDRHNIQPGTTVEVSGCNESAYNGTFEVSIIKGFNTFEYTALSTPSAAIASGKPIISVTNWYGAVNRLGTFDDQNGIFFEYDGQKLYAVRRQSTFQLSGRVSVVTGINTVTQTNAAFPTYFSKQLTIGDTIVIRGQSYRVFDIESDGNLIISPSYRGANADYATVSRVENLKTEQAAWNLDKCDGNGPSGYNLNLARMQMFYMDYSWYGAGFVRWGFRGQDGNVIYCHKLINNNQNTEAYMRSGNLPARYETDSDPPKTQITQSVSTTDSYIGIGSTAGFPTNGGVLLLRNGANYEYVSYAGIGTTAFTGVVRGKSTTALDFSTATGGGMGTSRNQVSGVTTTNLQIGMRALHPNLPEGTWISAISSAGSGTITLVNASTGFVSGIVTFVGMGGTVSSILFSGNNPAGVELAYPTFGPTISHWGTSVIMDGRFDTDKSLIFTYGQTGVTTVTSLQTRALFSIRVAPSVDNGIAAGFGARELINRMQLTLKSLDITSTGTNTNLLVQAILNGVPSQGATWTNAVGNATNRANSSLAQIADYASLAGATTVNGGEVIAGFFVGSGANSIDLTEVRDLGNSILGGGGTTSNTQIYPDGPDTLTIVVTNLRSGGGSDANVFGRISWTEAQA